MNSPLARLKSALPALAPAARRLAGVIVEQPDVVVAMSIAELAKAARVSEGSVIGLCQQMGARGFPELKIAIAREIGSSRELLHEDVERDDATATVIAKIAASHRTAIDDTTKVLDAAAVDRAVGMLGKARRIEIYGIGASAPIAEDAANRFLRLGLDTRAMVDSHSQAVSAAFTGPDVATITISHSGRTRETLMATRLAKQAGARTICVTNFGKPPLLKHCDVALFTAAVETRYRMEAMASRVAQLVVVDTLYARLALERWESALEAIQRSHAILGEKRLKSGSE
jgi:DNA-binding MurR/RpiR family transcriptional regulator